MIVGRNATVAGGGNKWIATIFVDKATDTEGIALFTVSGLKDSEVEGNYGEDVSATTGKSTSRKAPIAAPICF